MNKSAARSKSQMDVLGAVIVAVLVNPTTLRPEQVHITKNLITNEGDRYYAQRGAGESPTHFTSPAIELGTAGAAPAKTSNRSNVTTKVSGSLKQVDSGYPKTDDDDVRNAANADVDVVTYRVTYNTGEANTANIDRVIITNWAAGSPGASEVVLSYAVFGAPFTKTSAQQLFVFVNHTMNGV